MVQYKYLTPEMREHFLEHGWVRVPQAIPKETVDLMMSDAWVRLGMDPNDKSTWTVEKRHMPKHRLRDPKKFAPIAWEAMCELLGGEDRVDTDHIHRSWSGWGDGLIVNFGNEHWENNDIHPKDLGNWHTDGDFFTHFLDSPEQGLLVIALWTDIKPRGGGTYVCEDAMNHIARWLYERPEGCNLWLRDPDGSRAIDCIEKCSTFAEMTGDAGDVVLMHPLMAHSASKNHLRNHRFITNPAISAREPFNFNRANPDDYSLVELKTLKLVGKESLPDWHITGKREQFRAPTTTQAAKDKLVKEELTRMVQHAQKTGEKVESLWLDEKLLEKAEGKREPIKLADLPISTPPPSAPLVAVH